MENTDNNTTDGIGVEFQKFLRKLPEKSSTTIRFFDRDNNSETFHVYNEDAHFAAKEVYQTESVIKSWGRDDRKVEYIILNRTNFESFVRDLLLVKQYRVEIYCNEGSKRGRQDWKLNSRGSPGYLIEFEELLFSTNEITVNNGVIGVKIGTIDKNKVIGIAHVNMNEARINFIEFIDNASFTNFESVLVQLAPKEAVIQLNLPLEEGTQLKRILERNNILVNEKKNSDFDSKTLQNDMKRLLKMEDSQEAYTVHPDLDKEFASSALCSVIKYLELLSNELYFNQFKIESFDIGLFIKMDSAACRALHIIQNQYEVGSKNAVTIYSVLNKCRTAQGQRLLSQFLRQPLKCIEKIEERLDLVEIMFEDIFLRQSLFEEHLRKIPDCQVIARKLNKNKAALVDIYRGYQGIKKLGKVIEDLEKNNSAKKGVLHSNFISPLLELKEDFDKYAQMIEITLDMESAGRGDYIVQSNMSEKLKELREQMKLIENKMYSEGKNTAADLKLELHKTLKLESSGGEYYFRVTKKDEGLIREKSKKGYTIIDVKSNGMRFKTEGLDGFNRKYTQKRELYEDAQADIVKELANVASGYGPSFEQLGGVFAYLDVIVSLAYVSTNAPTPYVRPKLHPMGKGVTIFKNLRHPCVESQPGVSYIPNDVEFEKDKKTFYIVTGPNMGGKSTYLRSVGVGTLLAHIGCFVPAEYAEISLVDAILARVGAGDSLVKGVSTFMAEMIESSFILKTATSDSLVLIDELGRGTSTYDGFGICWAISEYLAKTVKCNCILATHFYELTALQDEVKNVVNVHVTAMADEEDLTMLFKIEKGPCDRSFGIHVAQLNDFPSDVINDAKMMARKLEDFASEEDKDDSEEAVQKRKKSKMDGVVLIDEFIKKYEDLSSLPAEEAENARKELIEGIAVTENPFIKYILKSIDF